MYSIGIQMLITGKKFMYLKARLICDKNRIYSSHLFKKQAIVAIKKQQK